VEEFNGLEAKLTKEKLIKKIDQLQVEEALLGCLKMRDKTKRKTPKVWYGHHRRIMRIKMNRHQTWEESNGLHNRSRGLPEALNGQLNSKMSQVDLANRRLRHLKIQE